MRRVLGGDTLLSEWPNDINIKPRSPSATRPGSSQRSAPATGPLELMAPSSFTSSLIMTPQCLRCSQHVTVPDESLDRILSMFDDRFKWKPVLVVGVKPPDYLQSPEAHGAADTHIRSRVNELAGWLPSLFHCSLGSIVFCS